MIKLIDTNYNKSVLQIMQEMKDLLIAIEKNTQKEMSITRLAIKEEEKEIKLPVKPLIATALKQYREKKRITQREFAKKIGLKTAFSITNLEKHGILPSKPILMLIKREIGE